MMSAPDYTDTAPNGTHPNGDWHVPADFLNQELAQIDRYREAIGVTDKATTDTVIGLAISGGGIRSAIFSLGVMQAMACKGVLRRFDYLSTVSGGSYIGAFYGSLFVSDVARRGENPTDAQMVATAQAAQLKFASSIKANPRSLDYLRDNCDYLTPNGTTDLLQSLAFSVRNWFALQYVIGTALVAVLLPVALIAWKMTKQVTQWPQHLSPLVLVSLFIATLGISPLSRAYWLTQNKGRRADRGVRNLPFVTLLLVLGMGLFLIGEYRHQATLASLNGDTLLWLFGWWLAAGSMLAFMTYEWVHCSVYLHWPPTGDGGPQAKGLAQFLKSLLAGGAERNSRAVFERIRNRLTNGYTAAIRPLRFGFAPLLLLTLALAFVDSAGSAVSAWVLQTQFLSGLGKGVVSIITFVGANGALVSLIRTFALRPATPAARGKDASSPYPPLSVVASVAAVLVTLLTLVFWSAAVHVMLNELAQRSGHSLLYRYFVALWVFFIAIAVIDGFCIQFLNMSSYQRLYSVRLTRTFLGATNPYRLAQADRRNLTELMPGDNIAMRNYFAPGMRAPVHIINATINKTVDWDSSLVQRHARGLPLGVGPAGMTIGQRFGTLECDWGNSNDASTAVKYCGMAGDYSVESLTLGDWVSISGAAVSTGLGQITRPAYSILLGVANVRLGYWWDTRSPTADGTPAAIPVAPRKQLLDCGRGAQLFGTQASLLDELLGRFDGPRARRWYLTDGGHYENTGAYELIRRGLRYIVVLDNGCDPDEHFGDIANLIEHVRVDFGIDIVEAIASEPPPLPLLEKQDQEQKQAGAIARSFAQFAQSRNCCAIQLTVKYPGSGGYGNLFVIKPRLIDSVPFDLKVYKQGQRSSFPQETTADQFFDTVQWEAHRALGFHIGATVF
ncbi:hypothetical protein WT11_27630 [Burkholderia stagnalis]|nr:hypothetical protein WT11_27630 [Burkholderia stagnalis]